MTVKTLTAYFCLFAILTNISLPAQECGDDCCQQTIVDTRPRMEGQRKLVMVGSALAAGALIGGIIASVCDGHHRHSGSSSTASIVSEVLNEGDLFRESGSSGYDDYGTGRSGKTLSQIEERIHEESFIRSKKVMKGKCREENLSCSMSLACHDPVIATPYVIQPDGNRIEGTSQRVAGSAIFPDIIVSNPLSGVYQVGFQVEGTPKQPLITCIEVREEGQGFHWKSTEADSTFEFQNQD